VGGSWRALKADDLQETVQCNTTGQREGIWPMLGTVMHVVHLLISSRTC
jgi:hypothetical protein